MDYHEAYIPNGESLSSKKLVLGVDFHHRSATNGWSINSTRWTTCPRSKNRDGRIRTNTLTPHVGNQPFCGSLLGLGLR